MEQIRQKSKLCPVLKLPSGMTLFIKQKHKHYVNVLKAAMSTKVIFGN